MSEECPLQKVLSGDECKDKKGCQVCSGRPFIIDKWYQRIWRPAAAFVFLTVVVFDFIVMPSIIELSNQEISYAHVIEATKELDTERAQTQFLDKVTLSERQWEPLTLSGPSGGSLFYGSFLAILGAAAWTRGREKISRVEHGYVENDWVLRHRKEENKSRLI